MAYVLDNHPSTEFFEEHLMDCLVCQEFVDMARMVVLRELPSCAPSLIAWCVLSILWHEESSRSSEPLVWLSA